MEKTIEANPSRSNRQDMVYNVYMMQNVPMDEFLKEDDAIVLIIEQGNVLVMY